MLTVTIPLNYRHLRIDQVLARLFQTYSRGQLSTWLKEGHIKVSHGITAPKHRVYGGECITFSVPTTPDKPLTPYIRPDTMAPLHRIYEDEDCLVICKPSNLVVHPGAGHLHHTLVDLLLDDIPTLQALPRAGLIHRLDKDTTGLLLIAKHEQAYTALTRQMQAREIKRHYQALVLGHVITGGRIETGFGRDPHHRLKMTTHSQKRNAITHYHVMKHYREVTLLEVQLMTGRTHQIRVHMAHIHHPIIGDPLYGGRAYAWGAHHQFKRQALHAYHLQFKQPMSHTLITCQAPRPDDFEHLLQSIAIDESSIKQ